MSPTPPTRRGATSCAPSSSSSRPCRRRSGIDSGVRMGQPLWLPQGRAQGRPYEGVAMAIQLPAAIEQYFQIENYGALDRVQECFATDAIVRDECQTYEGVAAIKNWMAATKKKYSHTVAPLELAERDDQAILKARLAGNFPGSPITVNFSFVMAGGKIRSLQIGG